MEMTMAGKFDSAEERLKKAQVWAFIRAVYGITEKVDKEAMALLLVAFDPYSAGELSAAASEYIAHGRQAPVPAALVEIMDRRRGNDDAGLEIRARRFLEEARRLCRRSCDIVSADWRGVAAFLDTYGSTWRFMTEDLSDAQRRRLEETFVRLYKSERPETARGHVLRADSRPEGYDRDGHCVVLGDYAEGVKFLCEVSSKPESLVVDNSPERLKALADSGRAERERRERELAEARTMTPEEADDAISSVQSMLAGLMGGMKVREQ